MADDHDIALATERRRAIRALLASPLLLTASDDFPLARRHAEWLKSWFGNFLGYRLVVEADFARLFKPGLGPGRGRPLLRATGPFTPRMYAYVTLAAAVLLTCPEQVLLSQLIADVRAAAVEARIELGDAQRPTERRALSAALRQLVSWNALREEQGTVAGYADDDQAEALLTVNRDIVAHLMATPPGRAATAAEFVRCAAEPGPGGARHAVRRRLTEEPVTYLDELPASERAWLRREQRRDERSFLEYTGLQAELRAEGAALLDPDEDLTDVLFPGVGTVAQAALLTIGALVEQVRPASGRLVVGVPIPEGALDRVLADLADRHSRRWAGRYVDDPLLLREAVIALLTSMGLLARSAPTVADAESDETVAAERAVDARAARGDAPEGTLVLLAAAARYAASEAVRS
ncbi:MULTISPECIES: TIGR02678 family protein [unclassified Micromonospora]|uniref:TIGR02678 family protein n=1 Tax=unclassified Micromonospora TaxID=2617518 RepID=UPI001C233F0A|nr:MULTISPECIES: TIGR02678 family protein [unclassified Micromonospora]MBU8861771.1 TIGR02678 family protein [Micromonospora sp. WMMB482]MDM4781349.1 TIGR02678 family protein [Micromonospora sp. b486]